VLVFQEFQLVPSEITEPLRAHISGRHADLHRYSIESEKALIFVGEYDPAIEECFLYPGREPGSTIDKDNVAVFFDDALLKYFEDVVGGGSIITPVASTKNKIVSDSLGFVDNGTAWPRSTEFKDRDVQVGDAVDVVGVYMGDAYELRTSVAAIEFEQTNPIVGEVQEDPNNAATQSAGTSIEQVGGPKNCVIATADGTAYNFFNDTATTEIYTVEVTRSSIGQDFTTARLSVTAGSGNDNQTDVVPAASASPTAIGTRGLTVTFGEPVGSSCSSEASAFDVADNDLIKGQKWQVVVTQAFEKVNGESGGGYTGTQDDVYIVEVTRGGYWAQSPQITVSTSKGLDFSGPTIVTDHNVFIPIGTKGTTVAFHGTGGISSESLSSSSGDSFGAPGSLPYDPVDGLRKGDKYYIPVTASTNGRASTLVLSNDLPEELQDTLTDLDLTLYIKDDIQISEERTESPPLVNYEVEDTQVCMQIGITAFHPTWTDGGVGLPLPVVEGRIFIEYREFLAALCDEVNDINDVADLGDIPGPLDPANELKWGVFKALENSNGTFVKYTAVCDGSQLDDWVEVLDRIKGRDDLYNLVPLTFDRLVQNLYAAHVDAESSPEAGNWKATFFSSQARNSKAVVYDESSLDSETVLATLEDDPTETGTQYTLLSVPAGNAGFITNSVQPADIVRMLYTVDGFGNETFTEFVVDQVLSEDSLLLVPPGHIAPIVVPAKIEVWHNLNRNEIAEEIATTSATFSNRRVCNVWPDLIGTAGIDQAGYFAAAAMAGLASGVVPQQGLTNVEIAGFDDVSRTVDFFNSSQLDDMAASGTWIITADRDGTIITRHALTTDNLDLARREEMIRRNVDSMSYLFLRRLRPFIGRTNVTPSNLRRLRQETQLIIDFFKRQAPTPELGPQLIDAEIVSINIHPLLKDRVQITVNLEVPFPLNNIELYLVV
jgi:hypothetical protein